MHINPGDTAWMLVATALVFFMMPGLALFYGGLVGEKNVIATMAQSFVAIGVVSVLWITVGYSLAFGTDHWGIIGGLNHILLHGVGAAPSQYAPSIPALLFMAFQMMFAVITPALIAGAFAAYALSRLSALYWAVVARRLCSLRPLGLGICGPATDPEASGPDPGLRRMVSKGVGGVAQLFECQEDLVADLTDSGPRRVALRGHPSPTSLSRRLSDLDGECAVR